MLAAAASTGKKRVLIFRHFQIVCTNQLLVTAGLEASLKLNATSWKDEGISYMYLLCEQH